MPPDAVATEQGRLGRARESGGVRLGLWARLRDSPVLVRPDVARGPRPGESCCAQVLRRPTATASRSEQRPPGWPAVAGADPYVITGAALAKPRRWCGMGRARRPGRRPLLEAKQPRCSDESAVGSCRDGCGRVREGTPACARSAHAHPWAVRCLLPLRLSRMGCRPGRTTRARATRTGARARRRVGAQGHVARGAATGREVRNFAGIAVGKRNSRPPGPPTLPPRACLASPARALLHDASSR